MFQCHNTIMENYNDQPPVNNLAAWRKFRGLSQAELAEKVVPPTTQGQIAHLESGRSGLSTKWLYRLADALETTAGMIIDHNPNDLDNDILEIWANANVQDRAKISEIARLIVKTGTDL